VAVDVWYDAEEDDPTTVATPAELDAILDVMVGWGDPVLADVRISNATGPLWRVSLSVGVSGRTGRGTLIHTAPGEVAYGKASPGPEWSPADRVLYYLMNSDTEFPPDAELPLADVKDAAHHFLTTGGGRLTPTDWHWHTPPPNLPLTAQ